ncbi:MAG TPA: hypothetical protein VL361_19300 [Candidatus Limnocylindrales bacterium]|nr:hypothetical protein [Candidatus Limnocylindrales bacterium]
MKRLIGAWLVVSGLIMRGAVLAPLVQVEEDVYTYSNADNGAGPMWCHGSTCLVRAGEHLFASGLETVPDVKPLNNCRWILYERGGHGWQRVCVDEGRTREPAPMAVFPDRRVFLSVNPTLGKGPEPNGGPARPDVLDFKIGGVSVAPIPLNPVWQDTPQFTEHSYRSFAADGPRKELILFQNIGYTHAEWTYRDPAGKWRAQGQLKWPWGSEYDKPEPIRVCYPNVAIRDRAVYFCGVSDVVEPYKAWRQFKRQLTGREWDYDFRRLFFTWTPDITRQPFAEWVEIASRDKTCGWISPGDLYVAPDGDVHLVWSERALDDRLRSKFFPEAKQSHTLNYAVVQRGKVVRRQKLEVSTEDKPGIVGAEARFQVTPEKRLFVVYYASGADPAGKQVSENRVVEIMDDGSVGPPVRVPLQRPFTSFFTATVRAGSPPSRTVDMLGQRAGASQTISYAAVRLY